MLTKPIIVAITPKTIPTIAPPSNCDFFASPPSCETNVEVESGVDIVLTAEDVTRLGVKVVARFWKEVIERLSVRVGRFVTTVTLVLDGKFDVPVVVECSPSVSPKNQLSSKNET